MENQLSKKYGLFMSICLVIGTIIGSGIFFRNEDILVIVGSNMWIGVAAWGVAGVITLASAYVFAILATKYEKVGGLVNYSEEIVGKKYGYLFGWFMATMFYPPTTGILAWVSARFTVVLLGIDANPNFSGETFVLAMLYLIVIYAINGTSPKIVEKIQISTTIIKVIPLILMAVVGTFFGLKNGITAQNLGMGLTSGGTDTPFLTALVTTVLAYLGWDTVINLNAEIKNAKRNLPIALVLGVSVIILIYVTYFIGVYSAADITQTVGESGVIGAFANVFGNLAGTLLFVFIIISCIGTLNGLTLCNQRAFYILAVRNQGIKPAVLSQVDKTTQSSYNAALVGLTLTAIWLVTFSLNFVDWYPFQAIDITEVVPISFQAFCIPIFVGVMVKQKELNVFNRFIAPLAATLGSLFLMYAAVISNMESVVMYAVIFVVIMIVGYVFMGNDRGGEV